MKIATAWTALGVIAAGTVLGFAYWKFWPVQAEPLSAPAIVVAAPTNLVKPEPAAPHYPLRQAAAHLALTPEHSDSVLATAFINMMGLPNFNQWIPDDRIAHRIVASIDGLGRKSLPIEQRFVRHVPGDFLVQGDDSDSVVAGANEIRYMPLITLLRIADLSTLVRVYSEFYPLFQQEYQNIGFPDKYFNDRLVDVIDLLLLTPDVGEPPHLKRPGVMYVYSDPEWEALSAGQKILMRVGPDNEALIKARLKEFRSLLIGDAQVKAARKIE